MSWTLYTTLCPIDPASPAAQAAWTADTISEVLDAGTASKELLFAASRNGGLLDNLKPLIEGHGLQSLAVFDTEPWNAPDRRIGTLLQPQDLAALAADIDRVFTVVATDPEGVIAAGLESCCATHLREHAEASEASLDPMIDDGDDLRSLFNFLRSLQALCQRSLADGRVVLVAQLC